MLLHHFLHQHAHDLNVLFIHLEQRINLYIVANKTLCAQVTTERRHNLKQYQTEIEDLQVCIQNTRYHLKKDAKIKLANKNPNTIELTELLINAYFSVYRQVGGLWHTAYTSASPNTIYYQCLQHLMQLLDTMLNHPIFNKIKQYN